MKKIKFLTLILTSIVLVGTGCLKDKDYDNHVYGINDADGSPAGVGFTLGVKYFNTTGLTLSPDPQNLDTAVASISLLSGKPASTDVKVTIQVDPTLLTEYNAENGTSILDFDPSLYSLPTTTITIPAGQTRANIPVVVPSTSTLDPNETYGLGLRIVSADAGYIIASNQNRILISIAIRNIYDGIYNSTGYVYHPTAPRAVDEEKALTTVNATTVACDLGDLGSAGYQAFFQVDPVTNKVTITAATGAAGAPYTQFDTGLPTTNPGYTPQWPGSAECDNTYDPATQTFKVRYGYMGANGWRVTEEILVREP